MATTIIDRREGRPPHPGKGERRGRVTPRGRQVATGALDEVRALLGDRPRRRDLLIEHLHLIQDRFGHISAQHLAALAEEMRVPQAEAYEVATFYAHFDVVREGEAPPPPLTIRVCDSITCEMLGAERLLEQLGTGLDPNRIRVVRAPCMGLCDRAPAIEIGHHHIAPADPVRVAEAVGGGHVHPDVPAYPGLNAYQAGGGYGLLGHLRSGEAAVEAVIAALSDARLQGLGGAGFPTGRKWSLVRAEPGPRLMCVNADEGEPGTFKDQHYLLKDPHRFLEGVLVAAHAVEAERVYIYLRDEYPNVREILLREIPALEAASLCAPGQVELRRGAGAYICGEESAMIESVEGKRGLPRHRPPYVAQVGLFGQPTLVNNVETLYWIRDIVERGADWFASQGRNGSKGLRTYSVSGRVREPGVKLAPAGVTLRELVAEFCGGMADGHELHAYLPGGASGGILPASMADIPLDFGKLEPHGCFVGSHAVVVLSDQDDLKGVVLNLMRFFQGESCGQCTPCRVGTEKAVRLLDRERHGLDVPLLAELAEGMTDASICGLGQAASNPLKCLIRYFPVEVGVAASSRPD